MLGYCFSMDTKVAAQNSLYIILFSQIANLLTTLITRSVPAFDILTLVLMVCGGIGGGMIGRKPVERARMSDHRPVSRSST